MTRTHSQKTAASLRVVAENARNTRGAESAAVACDLLSSSTFVIVRKPFAEKTRPFETAHTPAIIYPLTLRFLADSLVRAMNQMNPPLSERSLPGMIVPPHRGQRAAANESLFVVRISQFRNDEAASRIRSAFPGASIVSIFPIREGALSDRTGKIDVGASGRAALTDRQQDVLALLVQGLSNKEIGRQLHLSHFTVRNHVSNILRLLDFHCRRDMREALAER